MDYEPLGRLVTQEDYSIQNFVAQQFQKEEFQLRYYNPGLSSLVTVRPSSLSTEEAQQLFRVLEKTDKPSWIKLDTPEDLSPVVRKMETTLGVFYQLNLIQRGFKVDRPWFGISFNFMGTGSGETMIDRIFNIVFYLDQDKVILIGRPIDKEVRRHSGVATDFSLLDIVQIEGLSEPGVLTYRTIDLSPHQTRHRFYYYTLRKGQTPQIRWSSYSNQIKK